MFMSFINVTNSFQTYFIVATFSITRLRARKNCSTENREQKRVQFVYITGILETNQEGIDIKLERSLQYVFRFSLLLRKTEKAAKRTSVREIFCIRGNRTLPFFPANHLSPFKDRTHFIPTQTSKLPSVFFLILLLNRNLKNNIHIPRKYCLDLYNQHFLLGMPQKCFSADKA